MAISKYAQFITVILAATLVSAAAAAPPARKKQDQPNETLAQLKAKLGADDFQYTSTPGFLFAGSKGREQKFEDMVELTSQVAGRLWKQYFTTRPSYPITVYLFKDKETYGDYALKYFAANVGKTTAGCYIPGKRALLVPMSTDPATERYDRASLVHELVHALMAADFPEAPEWLQEGMTTLFEQYEFDGNDKLKGIPGLRLKELQKAIQQKRAVPLNRLLAMDNVTFQSTWNGNRHLNYAHVRYLCLYLQNKGALQNFYHEFHANIVTDRSGAKTLQKILGRPMKEIEDERHRWVANLH